MFEMKTPWVDHGDSSNWDTPSCSGTSGAAPIFDADGDVVAFAVAEGWNDRDAERRTTIIRAVNSFEALTKALEECVAYIRSPLRMSSDAAEAERRSKIVERGDAALNFARSDG